MEKLSFLSDDAVKKTVYFSLMEIEKKWTMPIPNWGLLFYSLKTGCKGSNISVLRLYFSTYLTMFLTFNSSFSAFMPIFAA